MESQDEKRFTFGRNWRRFLSVLNEERIENAAASLREMLGIDSLAGKSFLDIGCGSGLFSLAALKLGAERVFSFDYDPESVMAASELRRRFFPDDERWQIRRGSVLDTELMGALEGFDIVYSWGVLHHTGDMWTALESAHRPVLPGGFFYIGIYNDQGAASRFWLRLKRLYCSNVCAKFIIAAVFIPAFILSGLTKDVLRLKNPMRRYTEYYKRRGMSAYYDWFDWLGGYPFEVAAPEEIKAFFKQRDFELEKFKLDKGRGGVNEYVFRKINL